ncbi:MAG: sel1 repeat family protein [Rhodospirillales bacterium]|nr:sel1 repeat family protein [Rhodospirillales bacterium]
MLRLCFALAVLILAACDPGARSTEETAHLYQLGSAAHTQGEHSRAFAILEPLAKKGHAGAQLIIGDMYNRGEGVEQDRAMAVMWFRRSAENGNAEAYDMLGQGMRFND